MLVQPTPVLAISGLAWQSGAAHARHSTRSPATSPDNHGHPRPYRPGHIQTATSILAGRCVVCAQRNKFCDQPGDVILAAVTDQDEVSIDELYISAARSQAGILAKMVN